MAEAETRMRLAECMMKSDDALGADLELHAVESNLASVSFAHRARLASCAMRSGHCRFTRLTLEQFNR